MGARAPFVKWARLNYCDAGAKTEIFWFTDIMMLGKNIATSPILFELTIEAEGFKENEANILYLLML